MYGDPCGPLAAGWAAFETRRLTDRFRRELAAGRAGSAGAHGMALPGNTDSRGVRLPPLHAEGGGQHAAELPGLVPGQRDACAIEGGEAGDPKVGFATCQELDWYQQPLPESVDHSVPDIGKACAHPIITLQTRIVDVLAAELSTDPRRTCTGGHGSWKSTATGVA